MSFREQDLPSNFVPRDQQGNHYGSNPTFTIGELDVLAAPKIGCTRRAQTSLPSALYGKVINPSDKFAAELKELGILK